MALKRLFTKIDADLVEASSGNIAIEKAKEIANLSLILLDVQMPIMNGLEVAEILRANEQTKHIPIIFLTATNNNVNQALKGYNAGAVDYISKPFIADVMLSKIRIFLDLWRLRAQLEAMSAAKNQFFSYMSHELRTPMNGVIGLTKLLSETNLDAVQRGYVKTILDSGQLLTTIVNDILDFSKLEAGKVELEQVPFDLAQLGREVLKLLIVNKQAADVELIFEYSPDAPQCFLGDPTRIRQILMNLVSNAIKFTDKGFVKLQIMPVVNDKVNSGGAASVTMNIEDTGLGISEEQKRTLFKSFSQANATINRTHGGSGLGLAICKMLVDLMGGEIDLNSAVGQGSVFSVCVEMPIADILNDTASNTSTNTSLQRMSHLTFDHAVPRFTGQVLLVEDTKINQMISTALLERFGVTVTLVENGEQAIQAWSEQSFDLIMMDYHMDVMDGLEATRIIRTREQANQRVPIIGQTADATAAFVKKSQLAGMDDCLAKPFGDEQLIRVFSKWLN